MQPTSRPQAAADSAWQLARCVGWLLGKSRAPALLAPARRSTGDFLRAARYAQQALARRTHNLIVEQNALSGLLSVAYDQHQRPEATATGCLSLAGMGAFYVQLRRSRARLAVSETQLRVVKQTQDPLLHIMLGGELLGRSQPGAGTAFGVDVEG